MAIFIPSRTAPFLKAAIPPSPVPEPGLGSTWELRLDALVPHRADSGVTQPRRVICWLRCTGPDNHFIGLRNNVADRPQAVGTKQIDNDRVVVTEWRFAPGAETGWHRHGYDYVVVPLLDGKLQIEDGKETKISELKAGRSYTRPIGVEHNVINANDFEYAFVEIEIKPA
jgi:quercetin dioxygenase-like cupin family protein